MKTRHLVLILLAVILLAIAGGAYAARDRLKQLAFDLTGEESTGSQVLGVAQLALNLAHPPLDTRPDVPIEHTGVNPFGINTFLQQEVEPAKREETLRLISEAGFHWIRQEFPWSDIEISGRGDFIDRRNNPQGIDAWAKYDNIVGLAEHYNIEIIARLSSPPAWSRARSEEEVGAFAPPDNLDDFASFATAVATRYKGRIHAYQIWNEPNIYPEWGEQSVNPEAYTDLLCRAYRAIKAVDPDAVILSGALAPTGELSGRDLNDYIFFQRMYDAGAGDCFDILSMQGYGLWSGPTDHRMRPLVINYARNVFIRDMMVRNGDERKPIWISEMNWNVAPEDVEPRYGRATLDQQARWAPLAYQRAQEEWPWVGVIFFWYFKRADDTWLLNRQPEAYFQMAAPDFTLMPVYDSMKEYTHQPPVMYRGSHAADHWVVSYGDGWSAASSGMQATAEAEPATFTFEGTSLQISFDPPHSAVVYSVDAQQPVTVIAGQSTTAWRGGSGRHSVVIRPAGNVVITGYTVRNDPPAIVLAIPIALIMACGVVYYALRRRQARSPGGS